jgi:dephospho-CoA kinase
MAPPFRIGLTGGIASGKSTVAQRFSELGIPVIDADEAARAVVAPGQPGLAKIVETFGRGILTADMQLDRRALRNLIFSDPPSRKTLERILHPLIRAEMERRAASVSAPYLVMAIPLLVEAGNVHRLDRILVVDVDEELQLQRLMARDSSTLEQARAILAAQASRGERLKAAHDVVINTGTIAELQLAVDGLHAHYLRLAAGSLAQK